MAHEIEGNKAFFVSEPAWHKIGTVLIDAPTIEEAWHLAYPHTLLKLDLEASIKTENGSVERMPLLNSKVVVRDDGKEFNTVGSDFELVQPMEVLNYFRPMLDSGLVQLESGGSLRGGSQMWALGKIKDADSDILPGDSVRGYVLMFTGFDGSLRIGTGQTSVRVVCANTLGQALDDTKAITRFKHTKNVRLRMDNAVNVIRESLEQFKKNTEAYKVLANRQVTTERMKAYVKRVFLTDQEIADPKTVSTREQNRVGSVIDLLESQRGLELVPAMRGTAWQGYNAVSQYLTHEYGNTDESRVQAQWFGSNVALNNKALQLAATM